MKRIKLEVYDEDELHASHGKRFVSNCILCKKENHKQVRSNAKPTKGLRLRPVPCENTPIAKSMPCGIRHSTKIDSPKYLQRRLSPVSGLDNEQCWKQQSIVKMPDGAINLPVRTPIATLFTQGEKSADEISNETGKLKLGKRPTFSTTSSNLFTEESGIINITTESELSPQTKKDAYKLFEQGIQNIFSSNWDTIEKGLEDVAIVLNSAPTPENARELLGNILPLLMTTVTFFVRSFRPKVATAACRAATAIFAIVPNCTQRPLFDQLVTVLLMKTGDINKTLKEEALRALGCMAEYLPNFDVVRTISEICGGYKNGHLRAAAAHTIYIMVQATAPYFLVDDKQVWDLLCPLLASLMEDGHSEARHYARLAFKTLLLYDRFYNLFRVSIDPAQLQRLNKIMVKLDNFAPF